MTQFRYCLISIVFAVLTMNTVHASGTCSLESLAASDQELQNLLGYFAYLEGERAIDSVDRKIFTASLQAHELVVPLRLEKKMESVKSVWMFYLLQKLVTSPSLPQSLLVSTANASGLSESRQEAHGRCYQYFPIVNQMIDESKPQKRCF